MRDRMAEAPAVAGEVFLFGVSRTEEEVIDAMDSSHVVMRKKACR